MSATGENQMSVDIQGWGASQTKELWPVLKPLPQQVTVPRRRRPRTVDLGRKRSLELPRWLLDETDMTCLLRESAPQAYRAFLTTAQP
jgi:hypothetical protein